MPVGLDKLKAGDFNTVRYEGQPDGSQIITLHKRGENQSYRLRVLNLNEPNEQLVSEEEVPE